ncbi:uncharacterized protein MYCFIDRAFT_84766 [Pseudocercospora fijiensis CIRAD86]|uniref:Uncharacterized protein n=1 Tax=Pseudocercospora fijiensis (strain CIRAD86) TaxID=383855 RepID=M3AHX9_PSEFD|nr:uncharacterized protein MYCFIDRAFT_84766 [Pseudocercospora fijiensis CIRAD86]EME76803.1 hypothetical protein MYCFIDRAFT_84766 [Pseudocercospora fijiensis CIRAD86]
MGPQNAAEFFYTSDEKWYGARSPDNDIHDLRSFATNAGKGNVFMFLWQQIRVINWCERKARKPKNEIDYVELLVIKNGCQDPDLLDHAWPWPKHHRNDKDVEKMSSILARWAQNTAGALVSELAAGTYEPQSLKYRDPDQIWTPSWSDASGEDHVNVSTSRQNASAAPSDPQAAQPTNERSGLPPNFRLLQHFSNLNHLLYCHIQHHTPRAEPDYPHWGLEEGPQLRQGAVELQGNKEKRPEMKEREVWFRKKEETTNLEATPYQQKWESTDEEQRPSPLGRSQVSFQHNNMNLEARPYQQQWESTGEEEQRPSPLRRSRVSFQHSDMNMPQPGDFPRPMHGQPSQPRTSASTYSSYPVEDQGRAHAPSQQHEIPQPGTFQHSYRQAPTADQRAHAQLQTQICGLWWDMSRWLDAQAFRSWLNGYRKPCQMYAHTSPGHETDCLRHGISQATSRNRKPNPRHDEA